MKTGYAVFVVSAVHCLISVVQANVLFTQDFALDPNLAAYYSSDPGPGQWNSILGGAIVNQALNLTRNGTQNASFTRSKDFSPTPQALIYRFDIEVSGNQYGVANAATWQVGSAFSASRNDAEATTSVHSRFSINLNAGTGAYSFRDVGDSGTFSGRNTLTWVINNSGVALPYEAPDHTVESLPNDAWDLWVGGTKIFNDRPATTPDVLLTDLKFAFRTGSGTITMDNFEIATVEAIPEPGLAGCWAAAFVGLIVVAGFLRNRLRGWVAGLVRARSGF